MAVPNLWRTKKQRYSLQAEICPVCTNAIFPPREHCPHCHPASAQPIDAQISTGAYAFTLRLDLPVAARASVAGDD
jgi:uncharacterized OB-fold protein